MLTPVRGFWVGAVLTVLGLAVGTFLITVMFGLGGGQELASNEAVRFVVYFFAGALLPLGLTLMALSLVARALVHPPSISETGLTEDREDAPSVPPRVNSRIAVAIGLALLVLGLASQLYLEQWTFAIQGDATFFRDFVVYLAPLLNAVMLPLGVLLIACAWILRIVEERRIFNA
ncbi:hypothetical protein [Cryobacterium fucosi]|uniref:Uncharacterized protein n=1 Tax=Cryobacterium fucosi TaxID=1259157 RepID=A0A4R9BCT0_9MICO|nr:hypothetical protein [Cryobacterium fucosi]TFD81158.1 hypothetical protein E3T48_03915 [Cryobacterium fucosi]